MDKLHNFLKGIAASNELLHKAFEKKAFIELVCIAANQIDALLRIAIILKHQLEKDNKDLIEELLFQGEGDKVVMEKKIYDRALDESIIPNDLYDKLYSLYNERNKVIHRYIISDITTNQIRDIAREFVLIREQVKDIVIEIEISQIKTGKGMTTESSVLSPEELETFFNESVRDKHGGFDLGMHK